MGRVITAVGVVALLAACDSGAASDTSVRSQELGSDGAEARGTTTTTVPSSAPSVSISRGKYATVTGCIAANCSQVVVSVSNMAGPYTVACYTVGEASPFWTYSTSNTTSQQCVWGYWGGVGGNYLQVVVNGVASNVL